MIARPLHRFALCAVLLLGAAPALRAATPPADPAANPVVARVGTTEIHLDEVQALAAQLQSQAKGMPQEVLDKLVLDRLISSAALAQAARKQGLEKDPQVQAAIAQATTQVLDNALISREVGPSITPAAVQAVYEHDYANKPGPEEVHARHILLTSKAAAEKVIAQLKAGAKFADLAKKYTTEPGGAARGGDLGFFKKDEMVPAFADAAFALKPGQFSQTPVHTQFGWHVIEVLARRQAPPPTLAQVQEKIRNDLVEAGVKATIAKAESQVKIERYNMDGTIQRSTDTAEPPK